MRPKEIVQKFYASDLSNYSEAVDKYFHNDCVLNWHSSKGFIALDFNGIKNVFEEISKTYCSVRFEISHLLQDKVAVVIRYTSFGSTLENPNEEFALAHFITIWEVKEAKIVKGFQTSQLADNGALSLKSFSK